MKIGLWFVFFFFYNRGFSNLLHLQPNHWCLHSQKQNIRPHHQKKITSRVSISLSSIFFIFEKTSTCSLSPIVYLKIHQSSWENPFHLSPNLFSKMRVSYFLPLMKTDILHCGCNNIVWWYFFHSQSFVEVLYWELIFWSNQIIGTLINNLFLIFYSWNLPSFHIRWHNCAVSSGSAYYTQSIDTIGRCEFSQTILLKNVLPQASLSQEPPRNST